MPRWRPAPTTSPVEPGSRRAAGAGRRLTAWVWAAAIGIRLAFALGLGERADGGSAHAIAGTRIIVFAAGLLTIALMTLLAGRVAGPRPARIVLVIGAFSPTLILASGLVAAHGLAACAFLAAVTAAWRFAVRPRAFELALLAGTIALAVTTDPLLLVPPPGADPGIEPLRLPGAILVTIVYQVPMIALAILGAVGGRAPARARALLAAVPLTAGVLALLRGEALAFQVLAAPYVAVSAALGLDRLFARRAQESRAGLSRRARAWRAGAFGVGLGLFALTAAGLDVPPRSPELAGLPRGWRRQTAPMTEWQVYEALRSPAIDPAGSRASYLERATLAIHAGLHHDWADADADRFAMRVPVYENWILFALSWIQPARFRRYEFVDYRRALARGVGECSEHAIVTCDALRAHGVPAKIVALSGHVVAMAQSDPVNDRWWILDADLGVVIPHTPAEVARAPALADSAYRAAGYSPEISRGHAAMYAAGKLEIYPSGAAYARWTHWLLERGSYVLIWLTPMVLIAPFAIGWLWPRARSEDGVFGPGAAQALLE